MTRHETINEIIAHKARLRNVYKNYPPCSYAELDGLTDETLAGLLKIHAADHGAKAARAEGRRKQAEKQNRRKTLGVSLER